MKGRKVLLVLPVLFFTASCDEQARRFAAGTKTILDQRSTQLTKKIAVEMRAYAAYAAKAAEDQHNVQTSSAGSDHAELANALAADYQAGRKPVDLWRVDLMTSAQADYQANKQQLMNDLDDEARFLQQYETLTLERDKVDALAKVLGALSKKQKLQDEIGALTEFASDTKKEFDQKICDALKAEADDASKKLYQDKKCGQ